MKKILIVITDGESQDGSNFPGAIADAIAKGIVRFAIGVSFSVGLDLKVYSGSNISANAYILGGCIIKQIQISLVSLIGITV